MGDVGEFGGALQVGLSSVGVAVAEIFGDRTLEKLSVLEDHAEKLANF